MDDANKSVLKEISLESAITTAIKIPGVRVNRSKFLAEVFSDHTELIEDIVEKGPVAADIGREDLRKLAKKLIFKRTGESSIASFAAGIPGGLAMAATIPADVLQFFGMSLRLAQELSYLYGARDLWGDNNEIADDAVKSQLMMYIGAMFGVSSATAGVRVLSTQIAKTTLKKLPQKALTKTFWYPIVKKIGNAIGVKVTKTVVANGVSKAIPIIGGVISGGLNFASMMPMANRLQETLDKSCFDYTDEEFESDQAEIQSVEIVEEDTEKKSDSVKERIAESQKAISSKVSAIKGKVSGFGKRKTENESSQDSIVETIKKLKELEESGVITAEEFEEKKKDLLAKL